MFVITLSGYFRSTRRFYFNSLSQAVGNLQIISHRNNRAQTQDQTEDFGLQNRYFIN